MILHEENSFKMLVELISSLITYGHTNHTLKKLLPVKSTHATESRPLTYMDFVEGHNNNTL